MKLFIVHVFNPDDGEVRFTRTECLNCKEMIVSWPHGYNPASTLFDHVCEQKSWIPNRDGWQQIARDLFLEGRDQEAINLIADCMGMVPP